MIKQKPKRVLSESVLTRAADLQRHRSLGARRCVGGENSVGSQCHSDEIAFHSFSEDMNSDGVQHTLSGVEAGGEAITVGFEDMVGGGDHDFEDVVFTVELVDDFLFI